VTVRSTPANSVIVRASRTVFPRALKAAVTRVGPSPRTLTFTPRRSVCRRAVDTSVFVGAAQTHRGRIGPNGWGTNPVSLSAGARSSPSERATILTAPSAGRSET
jgi:hypothetical protein